MATIQPKIMPSSVGQYLNNPRLMPLSRLLLDEFGEGNCFPAAARLMDFIGDNQLGFTLVHLCHGVVLRPSDKRSHYHAWTEVFSRIGAKSGWAVMDVSCGRAFFGPRDVYYKEGGITPSKVTRYDIAAMRQNLLKHEHYGPWRTPWQVDESLLETESVTISE